MRPARLHLLAAGQEEGAVGRRGSRGRDGLLDARRGSEDRLDDDAGVLGQEREAAHHLADLGQLAAPRRGRRAA